MKNQPLSPRWEAFREELIRLGGGADQSWVDFHEIHDVLSEAMRKGIEPTTIISCRSAASTQQDFHQDMRRLVDERKWRLLIVDDEAEFASLLKLNLVRSGKYEVEVLSESVRVYDRLREFGPDLLIMDLLMPELDGQTILNSLRAEEETAQLPVIMLTALLPEKVAEAVNHGGTLYLSKPVSLKTLTHCIEEHLSGPTRA
jgi:CheY-like chemotaxis protein